MRVCRGSRIRAYARAAFLASVGTFLVSCATPSPVVETPIVSAANGGNPTSGTDNRQTGLVDEIKSLIELGTPPSLVRALDIIRSRDLSSGEFGRAMTAVCVVLMQRLYPEIPSELPPADPPPTNQYTRILREAERGAYTPPSSISVDYLEHVLPFLALLNETRAERLAAALPDLEKASRLGRPSVLDAYFLGLALERRGLTAEALAAYNRARAVSEEAYPAAVGAARILAAEGKTAESIEILSALLLRYPDNLLIKRELARAYYQAKDWSRAAGIVAEVLQRDPKDSRFTLMRAHILVEQGSFTQAQPLLDAYAAVDAANPLYLILRARVQAEGYKNRDSALTYLRALLRLRPDDEEALAYAAKLLLESARPEELAEGRMIVSRLTNAGSKNPAIIELALKDAVARNAWRDALPLVELLLAGRRTASDLRSAYAVYRGLGELDEALAVARELFERDQANLEWTGFYVSALVDSGQNEEAARILDARLPTMSGGSVKSRFLFLRSRLRADQEAAMGDLRSSLFEDPRNLDSLVAMLDIYHERKDERRAVYYLKQALALAPDNQKLLRYREIYAEAMGSAP